MLITLVILAMCLSGAIIAHRLLQMGSKYDQSCKEDDDDPD